MKFFACFTLIQTENIGIKVSARMLILQLILISIFCNLSASQYLLVYHYFNIDTNVKLHISILYMFPYILLNLFILSLLAKSMEMQNTLRLIAILLLLDAARTVASSSSFPSFSPIVIQAHYEQNYTYTINATVEYVFLYPASNVSPDKTN